jgi:predicted AAA+ superfamily ATPase
VHAAVSREAKSQAGPLKLVEIHREDISTLPRCLAHLRQTNAKRFILFCDDLSFEAHDTFYKTLKAVLEGGVEGRPEHVIFYATSNRRHLTLHHQPIGRGRRDRVALRPLRPVDRFPQLQPRRLSRHGGGFARYYRLPIADETLTREALAWALARRPLGLRRVCRIWPDASACGLTARASRRSPWNGT